MHLLIGLVTFLFLAQLPNPVTAGDSFDISGSVLDSVTGKPVARAEIALTPQAQMLRARFAVTDNNGAFTVSHVALGVYDLTASKTGYSADQDAYRKVILVSGTQPAHFDLKLLPQAVLTGSVTDENGDAVADAKVIVFRPAIVDGHKKLNARESAATDDRGVYRFSGLGPGHAYVAATARASRTSIQNGQNYAPTFAPNASDVSSAQEIVLAPGTDQTADVRLTLAQAFHVAGRVEPAGAEFAVGFLPLPGDIAILPPDVRATVIAGNGRFTLTGVPAGNYLLAATTGDERKLTGFRQISVGGDMADVEINANGHAGLTGTVRVDGDNPNADAVRGVGLTSLFDSYSAPVSGSGAFRVDAAIPPRTYRLSIDVQPSFFVRSAVQAGRDVLRHDVVIGEQASEPVTITAAPNGATVETNVVWPDGGPSVNVVVVVLEQVDGEMRLVTEAKVAAPNPPATNRPALIGNLRAGDFLMYAFPDPVAVEYSNLDALRIYDAFAVPVTVGEGQQTRATVKVALPPG